MRSLLVAVAIGLVGAVIIHILIIMGVPHLAEDTAWVRVNELGPVDSFHALPEKPAPPSGLVETNPFLRSAICVFDATDGPIHISDGDAPPFWSLAVFDPHSNEVFSMNDRSAVERRVDLTLATETQMIALQHAKPDSLGKSIFVQLPQASGYVVLRTIAEDATWDRIASRFLSAARCEPVASP